MINPTHPAALLLRFTASAGAAPVGVLHMRTPAFLAQPFYRRLSVPGAKTTRVYRTTAPVARFCISWVDVTFAAMNRWSGENAAAGRDAGVVMNGMWAVFGDNLVVGGWRCSMWTVGRHLPAVRLPAAYATCYMPLHTLHTHLPRHRITHTHTHSGWSVEFSGTVPTTTPCTCLPF